MGFLLNIFSSFCCTSQPFSSLSEFTVYKTGFEGITNALRLGNPVLAFFGPADKGSLCKQFMPVVSPALNDDVVFAESLDLELLASRFTEDLPSVLLDTISTRYFYNLIYSPGVKSGVVLKNFYSNYWHLVLD